MIATTRSRPSDASHPEADSSKAVLALLWILLGLSFTAFAILWVRVAF